MAMIYAKSPTGVVAEITARTPRIPIGWTEATEKQFANQNPDHVLTEDRPKVKPKHTEAELKKHLGIEHGQTRDEAAAT